MVKRIVKTRYDDLSEDDWIEIFDNEPMTEEEVAFLRNWEDAL